MNAVRLLAKITSDVIQFMSDVVQITSDIISTTTPALRFFAPKTLPIRSKQVNADVSIEFNIHRNFDYCQYTKNIHKEKIHKS